MRFFVDISKSTKKDEKIKVAGDSIIAIYSIGIEPATSIIKKGQNIVSCRSTNHGLSLIATRDGVYYISALSVEEINQRIVKAEADAMNIFKKRLGKSEKNKNC